MKKTLKRSLSILLSLAMIISLFTAAPISAKAETTVTYIDADGTLKSAEVVPLTSKDLTPGWYAVMSDLEFNDRMSCSGDVHLILCDGCTLSAKMGITVNKNNSLTIYGQSKGTGHLNATQTGGFYYPAVIGSTADLDSGLITINGGSINAKNVGYGGAAIGGGSWGFGTVVINGGNIEATADYGFCSIGGGSGAGGDVTINGGIIYAKNKDVAIGGCGEQGAQTVVTINGGEVTAKAAAGPAIGTSYDARCVININGGIVDVTADNYALGSKANDTEINLSWTNSADRIIFNNGGAKGTVTLEKAFTDGTTVYAANTVNPGNLGGKTLMPSPAVQFDVNWDLDDGSYPVSQNLLEGTRPVYSGDIPEKPNSEFVGWRDENGNFFEPGEPLPAIHAQKTYTATYRVNYIDENGIEQTMLSSAYRDVTSSGASAANWTSGWYVLNQDVDFGSIGVSVSGDVHLVLCDGCTLTVPEGIELNSESSFSIYCQQQGTGALVVTDPDDKTAAIGGDNSSLVKNITINGGVINVTGGTDAPAIGVPPRKNGPVNITINGGTVNATGGAGSTTGRYPFDFSAGIGSYSSSTAITINGGTVNAAGGAAGDSMGFKGSSITINGGNVTASSQGTGAQNGTNCGIYVNDGGEIRLGWTNKTDSIMSNSYRGTVILEKPFVSNGTVYQAGTADNNAIAAKELTPSYTERNVNIGELSHGTVTVDSVAQVVGNTVKLNVTPDSGYMISNVMCGNTQLTPVNGVYSFVMPDTDVTVTAEFVTGDIDLVVGGTAVNRMNFGDILGDGTASYDYDTNTLSLNNAVIEIAKYKDLPTAFGIRYNVDSEIPFKIVLSGTNVIADNTSDDAGTKYGIALTSTAPSYEITGGTLTISCSASGNTEVCGIHTRKNLTVNGTQLTENITTGGTAIGIGLYQKSPVVSITNGASVSLDINGSDGAAFVSNQKNKNISIGTESILTVKASNGVANDYVSLTKGNYEVIVNTSASENGASQWDQTTALSAYKYIQITKYKVLTGTITHGTLTSDLHYYDPGEVVTLTCEADNGYHLHSVSLAPVYEISSREITLTAIDGTNADGSQSCHKLVDGNSESKWTASKENSYIIMDAQNKVNMTGYSLITGNENEAYYGRNWKDYTIYGANFESAAQATRDSSEWNEIKAVVDDNVLEEINCKRYDFTLDSPAEEYRYYKIEIASNKGGTSCQMSEFILKGRSSIPEVSGSGNTRTFIMPHISVVANAVFRAHTGAVDSWTWSNDNSSCTADIYCTECGLSQHDIQADVTSEQDGDKTIYIATAVYYGKTYTTRKVISGDEVIDDAAVVIWKNMDGTLLKKEYISKGTVPSYVSDTPVLPGGAYKGYYLKGWTDGTNRYTDTLPAITEDKTYTAFFYHDTEEPYIDESGEYILGVGNHYLIDGMYYTSINGQPLSSPHYIRYFSFQELSDGTLGIIEFSGSIENNELVIPKTFRGKKITILGGDFPDGVINNITMFYTRPSANFKLVLNENITTIRADAFNNVPVSEVVGDTSGLATIGDRAFRSDNVQYRSFRFDYPGLMSIGNDAFKNVVVTANIKHATKLVEDGQNTDTVAGAQGVYYHFTDEHTGEIVWNWNNDYTSATLTVGACLDSRCNHTQTTTTNAEITEERISEQQSEKAIYTATANLDGVAYTDTKEIIFYYVTAGSHDNGTLPELDNIAKLRSGAHAVFTCIPNEGFQLGNVTISNANERADVSLTAINGSSGNSAGYSGNLVDSDDDTYWGITADSDNTVILKADKKVRMMEYSLTTAADALDNAQRNWKSWTIYGANFSDDSEAAADSREWKLIAGAADDNVLQPVNSTKFDFTLDTPADSYGYYKIVVAAPSNGEELRMAEFEMKAVAPGTKLTNVNDRFEFTMPDYSVIVSAEFVPETFTIKWYNFDGTLIETDENVSAGEYPIFNGSLPATIEIDGNQLYFYGWESEEGIWRDGELPVVSKSVDYIASYREIPTITTAESENGTVSPDTDAALPGSTVTVTAAPQPGYHLGDLNVKTDRRGFTDLTALSGSGSSYENLVDGSMDDPSVEGQRGMQWQTDFTGSCYVILKAPCKVAMSNYHLFVGDYNYTGDDRNWKDWTIYGANFENDSQAVRDSSKWQTVHEVTDDTRMTRRNYYYSSEYNLNSTAEPYQYYKIEITASKGADIIQMSEFAMKGVFYVNTVYVDSTTRTFTMPEQNVELQAAFESHTLQGEPVWTWANDYSTASAVFTCSECGETQTFDAAVTSEASGKKTVYTAAVTVNGVEYTNAKTVFSEEFGENLAGCTVRLDDAIGVNFFMELSDTLAESETAYMQFTLPNDDRPQVPVKNVKDELQMIDGHICYVFSCSVAAKEMTSEIKAQIIDGTNEGTEYTYTVKRYADTILNDEKQSKATKDLVKAMLKYGAATQMLFNYNPTELPDENIGDFTPIEHTGGFDEQPLSNIFNNAPSGMTLTKISLILESQTALRLYFTPDINPDIIETYEENGETKTRSYSAKAKGKEIYYEITGFAPSGIFASRTLKFDSVDTDFDVTIGNYANWAVNNSGNDALAEAILALYNYDEYAKAYVDNNYTPGQGGV